MKKQSSILSFALSLFFFSVVTGSAFQAQAQRGARSDVSVSRTVSAGQYAADGRPMVIVTVTIKKDAYTGPGQIQETIPSDFQAVLISSSRASFQTSSGKAIFVWSNIQADRVITVSYALEAMYKTSENQTISGQFFYQNQSFPIAPTSFVLDVSKLSAYKPTAPTSTNTLEDIYYSVFGTYPQNATSAPATANATTTPPNNNASTTNSSQPVQNNQSSATPPPATTQQQSPPATSPASSSPSASTTPSTSPAQQTSAPIVASAPESSSPAPATAASGNNNSNSSGSNATPDASSNSSANSGGDLVYRVQIIAVGDKSKLPHFLRQYKITEQPFYDPPDATPVRVMVGSYSDYNSAKARCNKLKGIGLTGAFVVPYYMGKRITIAEAATHTH